MKRSIFVSLLLLAVAIAPAQSLKEYLRLRQKNGIDHAVEIDALQEVMGAKVLELRGVVKGSFRQGAKLTLLLGSADGTTHEVDSDFSSDWLVSGDETPARLLVRAFRSDDSSTIHVVLLGAAKEEEISPIDDALVAKRQSAAKAAAAARVKKEGRRSGRYDLFGPIGRHADRGPSRRQWVLPAYKVAPKYAYYIKGINPRLSDDEALRMAKGVVGFCINYGVDARFVMAVISIESGFDPMSVSHAGAMGLGQLMPGTARWMGVANPFDDIDNIYGMVKLLRTHLDQYWQQTGGDLERTYELTLAAYNAGEGAVRRHGGVPPYRETQAYVRHVLTLYYRLIQ